jgi:hypothetical protein
MQSHGERGTSSAHVPTIVCAEHGSRDRMSATFDVVVVGAGPGGIAAATVAAEAGLRVCLLDDNRTPGGQIWRGFRAETAKKNLHGEDFLHWTDRLSRSKCEVWCGWQVTDHPSPGFVRVEREAEFRDIVFRRLILATGARERFVPFPGWTLPGVTGVGGLQAPAANGCCARDSVERAISIEGNRSHAHPSGSICLQNCAFLPTLRNMLRSAVCPDHSGGL